MVPMLRCGLLRSNFAFATLVSSWTDCCVRTQAGTFLRLQLYSRSCQRPTLGVVISPAPPAPRRNTPPAELNTGESLSGRLGDDLLGHGLGDLGIRVEHHGVVRPALGLRPQVADVAEHLRQRDLRPDDACTAALLHGLDLATAGVQVTDDLAHVVLGR